MKYEEYARLRDLRGMTDYKVAQETGISRSTFSEWKKGAYTLKYDKLVAIAKCLGMSMAQFMSSEMFSFDDETNTWRICSSSEPEYNPDEYYLDDDAKDFAQFLFSHPEYRVLFDASRKVKPEDLKKALAAIGLFIDEE